MMDMLAQVELAQVAFGPTGQGQSLFSGLGLYLLFFIPPLLLGLWAQWRVKSAYGRGSQIPATSRISGAEAAQMILDSHDIRGVRIEQVGGFLSDHYDPKHKVLRLSPDVYSGRSVAALGIAAHEAGHAIQDATNYGPLVIRNGIVPMAAIGSNLGMILIMVGMFAGAAATSLGRWAMIAGIALFTMVVVFQLINLPVEFDASRRAKDLLKSSNIVAPGGEARAMSRVLNAAALTYVAATVGAIATLLYYVLIFMSSQRRE